MCPWFDSECRAHRRDTRRAEKLFRKTYSSEVRQVWDQKLKSLHQLYETKERLFWQTKLVDAQGDSRKLWRTVSTLLGDRELQKDNDSARSADEFARYFFDKLDAIRSETAVSKPPDIFER
jgi:hypothetical protein